MIKDTVVTDIPMDFSVYKKPPGIIHVQIGKYYEPINKKNKYAWKEKKKLEGERKQRYITATIFACKRKGRLLNKKTLSAFNRKEIVDKSISY